MSKRIGSDENIKISHIYSLILSGIYCMYISLPKVLKYRSCLVSISETLVADDGGEK